MAADANTPAEDLAPESTEDRVDLSVAEPAWEIVDDTEPTEPDLAIAPEESLSLDVRRIERIATLHKAGRRARVWNAVGVLFCVIGAVDLAAESGRRVAAGDVRMAAVYGSSALVLGLLAVVRILGRRREASGSDTAAGGGATPPPDFEPLGDGIQRWRNLEEIR